MQKRVVRILVFAVTTIVLCVSATPQLAAASRHERERDVPSIIAKLVARWQRLFGMSTLEDFPGPPKP